MKKKEIFKTNYTILRQRPTRMSVFCLSFDEPATSHEDDSCEPSKCVLLACFANSFLDGQQKRRRITRTLFFVSNVQYKHT